MEFPLVKFHRLSIQKLFFLLCFLFNKSIKRKRGIPTSVYIEDEHIVKTRNSASVKNFTATPLL